MKIYVAGGWFNEAQEKAINELYDYSIKHFGEENCFLPRDHTKDIDTFEELFKEDIKHLDESDIIIASTAGKDMGTLFECGYAFAKGKQVVYYTPGINKINLMLAKSGIVCRTLKELDEYFSKGVVNEITEIE